MLTISVIFLHFSNHRFVFRLLADIWPAGYQLNAPNIVYNIFSSTDTRPTCRWWLLLLLYTLSASFSSLIKIKELDVSLLKKLDQLPAAIWVIEIIFLIHWITLQFSSNNIFHILRNFQGSGCSDPCQTYVFEHSLQNWMSFSNKCTSPHLFFRECWPLTLLHQYISVQKEGNYVGFEGAPLFLVLSKTCRCGPFRLQ